jgi:hypothetical protein
MPTISSKMDAIIEHIIDDIPTNTKSDTEILIDKYRTAQNNLKKAQSDIELATNKACGDLALKIRHKLSGLNVSLNRFGCTVGYKHKTLTFKPNLLDQVWVVTGNNQPFTSAFIAKYSPLMRLSNISEISDAVAQYFKNYYRSLNEDINGDGMILVEGSSKSVSEMLVWRSSISLKIRQAVK